MPIEIKMPALSPTMETGNLVKWNVKEGDAVEPGQVIAEIETDKANMEVEAADEGTLGKIVVKEGTDDVKVGATIAILLEEGEDKSALKEMGKKEDLEPSADKKTPEKEEKKPLPPPEEPAPSKPEPSPKPSAKEGQKAGEGKGPRPFGNSGHRAGRADRQGGCRGWGR